MSAESLLSVQIPGLIAILGATVYTYADTLLLATKVNLSDYPHLEPHGKLLSGMEKMVILSGSARWL